MAAVMSKNDRVAAALRGDPVDRVPVSAWWHDYAREWSAAGLAEATVEAYRKYDWDYVKVNPRATLYGEDWGARFRRFDDRQPAMETPAVSSPEDVRNLQPLDVKVGAYGEQLEALRIIAPDLQGEVPFIQTVFSPLAVISRAAGSTKFVQKLMREAPDDLLSGLDAATQTLAAYSSACLETGAAGIFFATLEWGSADHISAEDYDRFARPFDLRVLRAVDGAAFNVLHVCRNNNHLQRLLDYPVAAFHWSTHGAGNPSLREISSQSGRAVMGGVSHEETMTSGSPDAVAGEAQRAIAETGGSHLLIAPGCSIEPSTPEASLRALVQAARS